MPRYRIFDQQGLNYLTCTVVGWVDVFTRATYRDIVMESLAYCHQAKGLQVFAYVLMNNHLHLIARAEEGNQLSAILRDLKNPTPILTNTQLS